MVDINLRDKKYNISEEAQREIKGREYIKWAQSLIKEIQKIDWVTMAFFYPPKNILTFIRNKIIVYKIILDDYNVSMGIKWHAHQFLKVMQNLKYVPTSEMEKIKKNSSNLKAGKTL